MSAPRGQVVHNISHGGGLIEAHRRRTLCSQSFSRMDQMKTPSPLEPILSDIQKALEARLYYLAIAVSLSLPDVCVALAREPGEKFKRGENKLKYEAWCTENLITEFQHFPEIEHLIAADVYRLRCGVVHEGNFGRDGRFERIIFTVPESGLSAHDVFVRVSTAAPGSDPKALEMMHESMSFLRGGIKVRPGEKALILDAVTFCKQVIDAARRWFEKHAEDPNVKENSPLLVRTRPQFPPYFPGTPVIA
jgi:hypothetical protein